MHRHSFRQRRCKVKATESFAPRTQPRVSKRGPSAPQRLGRAASLPGHDDPSVSRVKSQLVGESPKGRRWSWLRYEQARPHSSCHSDLSTRAEWYLIGLVATQSPRSLGSRRPILIVVVRLPVAVAHGRVGSLQPRQTFLPDPGCLCALFVRCLSARASLLGLIRLLLVPNGDGSRPSPCRVVTAPALSLRRRTRIYHFNSFTFWRVMSCCDKTISGYEAVHTTNSNEQRKRFSAKL